MKIEGPMYWIAGTQKDGHWTVLHFGWSPREVTTVTGQPVVETFADEASYLSALRTALAASDHVDRKILDCPYEGVVTAALKQRSGIFVTKEDMATVNALDYDQME